MAVAELTMMRVHFLSVGLSCTKIHDMEITYKNYGPSRNLSRNDLFVDLLYATSINYGDINWNTTGNGSNPVIDQVVVNQNTPKNNIGFRIGYAVNTLPTVGYGYNIEAGIMPGTDSKNGLYFLGKFNISLNFRVGK